MEALLLLLLIVPALLVLLAPVGKLRQLGQNPMAKPAIVAVILLAGWVALTSMPESREDGTDYARGDTQLRAMLD